MKRRHSSVEPGTITGIAEATAERVRLSGEILKELPFALARNEKMQQKFRLGVLSMLAKIQATVTAIHGAQLVFARKWEPGVEEKVEEDAKGAEELIARMADKIGLAMVRHIYGESEPQASKGDARRKWSDWEI
jgi:hypothetical protein